MLADNKKIKVNKAKCLSCGQVIESKHRHDYRYCICGNIFVDGGDCYIRHGYVDFKNYVNLTEYE